LERAADDSGVRFVAEGFVDRRYQSDGRLVARAQAQATHTDPELLLGQLRLMVLKQPPEAEALPRLDHSNAVAFHESWQRLETLCIHGDRSEAVELAMLVTAALRLWHVRIEPFLTN
jgi:UPF0271 protein